MAAATTLLLGCNDIPLCNVIHAAPECQDNSILRVECLANSGNIFARGQTALTVTPRLYPGAKMEVSLIVTYVHGQTPFSVPYQLRPSEISINSSGQLVLDLDLRGDHDIWIPVIGTPAQVQLLVDNPRWNGVTALGTCQLTGP